MFRVRLSFFLLVQWKLHINNISSSSSIAFENLLISSKGSFICMIPQTG